MTTNWFAIDQGRVAFSSYEPSRKIVNLRRDPRITGLCASGDSCAELAGASIRGRVSFADNPDENLRLPGVIGERNRTFAGPAKAGASTAGQRATKRVCVIIEPEKVVSWDHAS